MVRAPEPSGDDSLRNQRDVAVYFYVRADELGKSGLRLPCAGGRLGRVDVDRRVRSVCGSVRRWGRVELGA